MTLKNHTDFAPTFAPSLDQLLQDAAVVPIEVVPRTEYREPLPSIGDIVSAMPVDLEPDQELVPTERLPVCRRAGGNRQRRNVASASVAAFALVAGAGVAMAAWMTPPRLGDAPEVPTIASAARSVDTNALSLAIGAEALARNTPAFVPPEMTKPDAPSTRVAQPQRSEPTTAAAFDRDAATVALERAAGSAGACRSGEDPSGVARAIVTFAPSGRVTSATVNGPPFAGTTTGGCIARSLRTATVPSFSGDHVTVAKTVVIY